MSSGAGAGACACACACVAVAGAMLMHVAEADWCEQSWPQGAEHGDVQRAHHGRHARAGADCHLRHRLLHVRRVQRRQPQGHEGARPLVCARLHWPIHVHAPGPWRQRLLCVLFDAVGAGTRL